METSPPKNIVFVYCSNTDCVHTRRNMVPDCLTQSSFYFCWWIWVGFIAARRYSWKAGVPQEDHILCTTSLLQRVTMLATDRGAHISQSGSSTSRSRRLERFCKALWEREWTCFRPENMSLSLLHIDISCSISISLFLPLSLSSCFELNLPIFQSLSHLLLSWFAVAI